MFWGVYIISVFILVFELKLEDDHVYDQFGCYIIIDLDAWLRN